MVKRYTLDEIRAMHPEPAFSKMTTAEKAAHLAATLEKQRERIAQQSRMIAELRRRMDPNEPKGPVLSLKTWVEVVAYVDRIASGQEPGTK